MSENLDLVRSIYAAWERGDWTSLAWADPEIEYIPADGGPWAASVKGVPAMAGVWREWLGSFEGYRVRAVEYRELDAERVLVLADQEGRGKTSGVGSLGQAGTLFHLRNGKVTRLVVYSQAATALADLGLA